MSSIMILTKLIESIKYYSLEKEDWHSNIFIFYNNKTEIQENLKEKVLKQLNYLKLFLLFILKLFILLFLVIQITKTSKETYDSLISIFNLIALIINLPIFIMMTRYFRSIRLKKKILLYFLLGINLILVILVINYSYHKENLDVFNNKEISLEIQIEKNITNRNLNIGINKIFNKENFQLINYNKNKQTFKNLQLKILNEEAQQNYRSNSQSIKSENELKKKIFFSFIQYCSLSALFLYLFGRL